VVSELKLAPLGTSIESIMASCRLIKVAIAVVDPAPAGVAGGPASISGTLILLGARCGCSRATFGVFFELPKKDLIPVVTTAEAIAEKISMV